MGVHAGTCFTPKQRTELWERWRSGQCVADIASEHPFGTIKRMTAGGRFLTRGLKKVGGEAALSVLAYNLIRAINLIGATTLCASLA